MSEHTQAHLQIIPAFFLKGKTSLSETLLPEGFEDDRPIDDNFRIRCPYCKWEPRDSDWWQCFHCGGLNQPFKSFNVCPHCNICWNGIGCLLCKRYAHYREWVCQEGRG